jgi:hypothetical protein
MKEMKMSDMVMPLSKALYLLTEAHTRDDDKVGFTVETLPQVFEWSRADYIEAWRSVRFNIGKPTKPQVEAKSTA